MNENNSNYKYIQFHSNIEEDSSAEYWIDNTICVFKSINEIISLIYTDSNNSIISYNLINNQKINEIKKAHKERITNFRHYLDKNENRDLILTISAVDKNIKIWNNNNWNCLFNVEDIYNKCVYSACFLNEKNKIYIITSSSSWSSNNEPIKVYDFNGNIIKKINDSNDRIFFFDSFYDKKNTNIYILVGCSKYVKSYDFIKNKLYNNYHDISNKDKDNNNDHYSIIIKQEKEITKLIESSCDGNIRIWNFHSGILLKKINIGLEKEWLKSICLCEKINYLFVGSVDSKMIIIDLEKEKVIEKYLLDEMILTIKKIIHPKYGECLISQGKYTIKIWKIKNNKD